jgi:hypothetical protein
VSALAGLDADVPGGTLGVSPLRPSPVGSLEVRGLQIAGQPFDVAIAADGTVSVSPELPGVRVVLG